jgi:YD repeat-containing protein
MLPKFLQTRRAIFHLILRSLVFGFATIFINAPIASANEGYCNVVCNTRTRFYDLRGYNKLYSVSHFTQGASPDVFFQVCCINDAGTVESCPGVFSSSQDCTDGGAPKNEFLTSLNYPSEKMCGSVIDTDNQALGENVPVIGASFELAYSSRHVVGRVADFKVHIPLVGNTGLLADSGHLRIQYAGLEVSTSFTATPNQTRDFIWDGRDGSGNIVPGSINISETLSFDTHPCKANDFTGDEITPTGIHFPQYYGACLVGTPSTQLFNVNVGHWETSTLGLGGWVPSILNFFDISTQQIYYGSGDVKLAVAKTYMLGADTGYLIPSQDGSEHYVFDSMGKHVKTLNGLTGDLIYSFQYDGQGHLTSIQDAFNNTTTFNYSGAHVVSIIPPFGPPTTLAYDSNGWLALITNPNGESHTFASTSGGLLTQFTKPDGHASSMTYDVDGLLLKDQGAGGNFTSLSQIIAGPTVTTIISTALGRTTTNVTTRTTPGDSTSQIIDSRGLIANAINNLVGTSSLDSPDKYSTARTQVNDIRLGPQVPFLASSSAAIDGTSAFNVQSSSTQSLSLANPADIYSIQTLQTATTLQNDSTRKFTTTYTGSNRTIASVTPLGKTSSVTLNSHSQIASFQPPGLAATSFVYDSNGRVSEIHRGSRITKLAYDSAGNIATSIDPMGRTTSYAYDLAGRVLTQTNPDGHSIGFTYDAAGNLTSLTPPGRSAHTFSTNLFDLVSSYVPAFLGGSSPSMATTYSYNLDKQLTQITRPDGKTINFNYDPTSGVLTSVVGKANHQ